MRNSKLLKGAVALLMSAAFVGNCSLFEKDDDDDNLLLLAALIASQCNVDSIAGNIVGNCVTGGDGVTVNLTGTATVGNGSTLTVLPGTIVKGASGAAIYVTQGGRLVADGTADKPIVFTSSKDVGSRSPSDWGGIILVGDAPISESSALTTEDNVSTPYGGTDAADDSGILRYVRVEFGGFEFSTGKEWNSFSFYAVGSGTKLEYLQSLMGSDDAFEWFGGTVNAQYLLSVGTSDDDIDMDEGYKGTVKNIFAYRYPTSVIGTFSSDPRAFELDGGKGTATADTRTTSTVQDFSMYGIDGSLRIGTVRDCASITMTNGQVYGYNDGANANFNTSSSDCSAVAIAHTCASVTANAARTSASGAACVTNDAAIQAKIVTTEKLFTAGNEDQKPTLTASTAGLGGTDWTANWTNWRWN